MKKIVVISLLILVVMRVTAQEYGIYQSSEAGITFLNHNESKDEIFPGTVITLSDYTRQLEIRTVLPPILDQDPPLSFDLKMIVASNRLQRNITSGKVFTATGTLLLNNISKQVYVQYIPLPEDTENEGKIALSLIAIFHLSDFFPWVYPDQ